MMKEINSKEYLRLIELLTKDPSLYRRVSDKFDVDHEIHLRAISLDINNFKFAPKTLITVNFAVDQNPSMIKFVPSTLIDESMIDRVLSKDLYLMRHLNNDDKTIKTFTDKVANLFNLKRSSNIKELSQNLLNVIMEEKEREIQSKLFDISKPDMINIPFDLYFVNSMDRIRESINNDPYIISVNKFIKRGFGDSLYKTVSKSIFNIGQELELVDTFDKYTKIMVNELMDILADIKNEDLFILLVKNVYKLKNPFRDECDLDLDLIKALYRGDERSRLINVMFLVKIKEDEFDLYNREIPLSVEEEYFSFKALYHGGVNFDAFINYKIEDMICRGDVEGVCRYASYYNKKYEEVKNVIYSIYEDM